MRFRVLVMERAWPGLEIERAILEQVGAEVLEIPAVDEDRLCELVADVDALAVCWSKISPRVLEAAPRCRLLARLGVGLDNVPLPAATQLGIVVTNSPDYCVQEVADHTLAVILATTRNLSFFHLRTKGGEYNLQTGPEMHRLRGRTVGLIGFGRIAQDVAQRAVALGLNVLVTTRTGTLPATTATSHVRCVPLEELLRHSDWVSLHAPLTDATRHLANANFLSQMKPTAWLINTARGALVDDDALWKALQANQLAGAALDVFNPEPADLSKPLFRDERVLVTPHSAFLSVESLIELRTRVSQQIAAALTGTRPEFVVNPQVFDNPACRLPCAAHL